MVIDRYQQSQEKNEPERVVFLPESRPKPPIETTALLYYGQRRWLLLTIVVEKELIRVWTLFELVNLVVNFILDPGIDKILGKYSSSQ